jgi:hypothetical protein
MAETVYMLCMGLSVACTLLLFRAYWRGPSSLLLWSSACFALLAVNNGILVLDMIIYPDIDFGGSFMRAGCGALAGCLLLFGLIWEIS